MIKKLFSKFFYSIILAFNYFIYAPPTQGQGLSQKQLLTKLDFKENTPNQCLTVKTKKQSDFSHLDAELNRVLANLLKGLNTEDLKALMPLFHPRLKLVSRDIQGFFSDWLALYGKSKDFSLYRLFATKYQDENSQPISCDDLNVSIRPQFGYPLQIHVLIQIRGEEELGRLYVNLVPKDKTWKIGAFHTWQWSYKGKDHDAWIKTAQEALKNKKPELAFIELDIARKLLYVEPFMVFAESQQYLAARDLIAKETDIKTQLTADLKQNPILMVGSSLSVEGVGLLLRFALTAEKSSPEIFADCKTNQETLHKKYAWFRDTAGIFCSYILPGEASDRDGRLGGLFIKNPAPSASK